MPSYGAVWQRRSLSSTEQAKLFKFLLLRLLQRRSGAPLFQGEAPVFLPLPPSPPLSPLQSAFIYRGQESFAVQMDPLRYYVVDFNKENQFWLCLRNQPHTTLLIHWHQPGQYIIRRNFIMLFVCLGEEKKHKGEKWKLEIRATSREERCQCFYKYYLSLFFIKRMLHPGKSDQIFGFFSSLSVIHFVYSAWVWVQQCSRSRWMVLLGKCNSCLLYVC